MIEQQVKEILAELIEVSVADIALDSSINNLDLWDSLTHLKLISSLEKSFEIRFEEDEFLKLTSVQDICTILQKKLPQQKSIPLDKSDKESLNEIIARILGVGGESINDDSSPMNIPSWDSFNGIMLIAEIEKMFEIKLTEEDVTAIHTVLDIRKILGKHGVVGDI